MTTDTLTSPRATMPAARLTSHQMDWVVSPPVISGSWVPVAWGPPVSPGVLPSTESPAADEGR